MVFHETKSMDAVGESLYSFLEQGVEASTILIIEENGLPAIAGQDDVIECSRIVNSWLPSHAVLLRHKLQHCTLDPRNSGGSSLAKLLDEKRRKKT